MNFGLFIGKNDLARFLAIAGLFSFVFSLMFPLEKRKELELEVVTLNFQIDELNVFCDNIMDVYQPMKIKRDSLVNIKDKTTEPRKVEEIDNWLKSMSDETNLKLIELTTKTNSVKEKEGRVKVLEKYVSEYDKYLSMLFWGGLISMFVGFVFWAISGVSEHNRLKQNETKIH